MTHVVGCRMKENAISFGLKFGMYVDDFWMKFCTPTWNLYVALEIGNRNKLKAK